MRFDVAVERDLADPRVVALQGGLLQPRLGRGDEQGPLGRVAEDGVAGRRASSMVASLHRAPIRRARARWSSAPRIDGPPVPRGTPRTRRSPCR